MIKSVFYSLIFSLICVNFVLASDEANKYVYKSSCGDWMETINSVEDDHIVVQSHDWGFGWSSSGASKAKKVFDANGITAYKSGPTLYINKRGTWKIFGDICDRIFQKNLEEIFSYKCPNNSNRIIKISAYGKQRKDDEVLVVNQISCQDNWEDCDDSDQSVVILFKDENIQDQTIFTNGDIEIEYKADDDWIIDEKLCQ